METLLATVGGGADGVENNTIWALVWTRPEPAGQVQHLLWPGKKGVPRQQNKGKKD